MQPPVPIETIVCLALAVTVFVGCSPGEPVTQAPQARAACSAAGIDLSTFADHPGLTQPANATRGTIVSEAVACDFEGLAAIGGDEFTYSFGVPDDPAVYWRQREQAGEPVLRYLVALLRLDQTPGAVAVGPQVIYHWPRGYGDAAARTELEQVFGADTVEGWYAPEGYLGWRVGIRSDGAWMYFAIGD